MRGRTQLRGAAAALAALALVAGCSSDGGGGDPPRPSAESSKPETSPGKEPAGKPPPAKGEVSVERTVATGLKAPWGLAPLPGGDLLVSYRDEGTIVHVDGGGGKKTELGRVPGTAPAGEGGLLGIAVPPGEGDDGAGEVYAYLTTASDNRIVRMVFDLAKDEGSRLGAPDTVFKGIPKGTVHNGGRIAFGPDGMLYAGTGESGDGELAQDEDSPAGKILRMTPDGEPPAKGNPDPDSPVLSLGHRNVQGLDWDADGRLWASEFGQDTWDELNRIRPGRNYGWPEAEGKEGGSGFTDPVEQWKPADASPSGLAVAAGSVWMAGLRGERLWRIPLDGTGPVAGPQSFLEGKYGRLRTVVPAGKDRLWLVTSETDTRGTPGKGDDRILELKVS
ncbi:PQQ-dependent sugar dehydrogenase [Streptomyces sp. HNM0574]|uniref:PQQ-dependent sugar dehydrogenase n=1 Tax=Streptomyces sp. HNM0574 TaxID=2714954 RepID=UPI003216DAE6